MTDEAPWYRHFWPWFLIAITSSAVVGGMLTLMVALNNPDYLVVSDSEYQQIRTELKAESADQILDDGPDDSPVDSAQDSEPADPDDGR